MFPFCQSPHSTDRLMWQQGISTIWSTNPNLRFHTSWSRPHPPRTPKDSNTYETETLTDSMVNFHICGIMQVRSLCDPPCLSNQNGLSVLWILTYDAIPTGSEYQGDRPRGSIWVNKIDFMMTGSLWVTTVSLGAARLKRSSCAIWTSWTPKIIKQVIQYDNIL